MDQNQSISNFTQESDGTWSLTGIWVIDDFPRLECKAQSPKFPIDKDTHMYLRFLNYLNRRSTRVSVIAFFNTLSCEFPMDLTVRLLNTDKKRNQEKTTHVVYSSTALRSYLDFNIRWSDLTEGSGFLDPKTSQVRIEFLFRHTLRPYELPLQIFCSPPPAAPSPRPVPIDDAKMKYNCVGINTKGSEECLNCVLLCLYSIPYFRHLVYSINTYGYEGTENSALPLQKLFAALQMSNKAVSSEEFVKISKWQPEHVAITQLLEAYMTVLSAVHDQIDATKFNQLFQIHTQKKIRCPDINYESVKSQTMNSLILKIDEKNPKTFEELLQAYASNPERIDEYVIPGSGVHTAFLTNEIVSFPYAIFINICRFDLSESTQLCHKIVQDLQIPVSFDFNSINRPSTEANDSLFIKDTWTLQSVIVHSGSPDNGRFHANIRTDPKSDNWLEYRGYEVCEIDSKTAVNSTDSVGLLYALQSKNKLLYAPCKSNQIPAHVLNPPHMTGQKPYMVTLVTEKDYCKATLRGEVGCGLVGTYQFPAQANSTFAQFLDVIASHLSKKMNQLLLWQVDTSTGDLVQPVDLTLSVHGNIDPQAPVMFLQISNNEEHTMELKQDEIMVFLKLYWKNAPYPLQFICHQIVKVTEPISLLYQTIYEKIKVDPSIPLVPFIERAYYSADRLNQSASFSELGIRNGDCLIFECPVDMDGFKPTFDFGSPLPIVRQPPQFPQYDGHDIVENDDNLFVDLTMEYDKNGEEKLIVPNSVELYYDTKYHLAVIGICMSGSRDPPQTFFKIPLSYPLDELEKKFSCQLGTPQHVDFYVPTNDGSQSNEIIDRGKFSSLKHFLVKLPNVIQRPIVVYIRDHNQE